MLARKVGKWDRVVDVVVVGSGGAALTAAVTAAAGGAQVAVLEKSDKVGGTTGVSGGVLWIPANHHMKEVGVEDSPEEALRYIRRLTMGREPDPALIDDFVATGADAVQWLEDNTPVRMFATKWFADYYADMPGGKREGRSLEPRVFEAKTHLGDWAARVRTSPYEPLLTMEEKFSLGLNGALLEKHSVEEVCAQRTRSGAAVIGGAFISMLLKGCLERGATVLPKTPARELVLDDDGRIVGVRAESDGSSTLIGARRGVVLAAGGYEWNPELVKSFLTVPSLAPLSPPFNEGDALIMAMEAGAAIANMNSAWWFPAMRDPTMTYEGKPLYHLGAGRNVAGTIVVNKHGRRFANEGTTYQDYPKSLLAYDPVAVEFPNESPVWMLFDQHTKDSQVLLNMMPGQAAPDWVARASSIRGLAEVIGVPPETLIETMERFNANAARGVDPDFHRGTVYWENFLAGGPSAAANLAPINQPPFYALPIYLGALGTNGGLRIDVDGRVRSLRGGIIEGLYAAGNTTANIFGSMYPAGGATIGPGVVFGHHAGKHAASNKPAALA
ncbi:MAG TPA: FAD-dependent oxidoreductase [Candidatus Binataceae bacterium]|nr:FAD-dependent oxidoreductase [Candidatus Binataceae bacterium]